MEWNLQGDIDSTLLLKALEVSNALSRCLNLDGKCLNHHNDVKRIAKDPILWKGGIEFPNGGGGFNVGGLCDNVHEVRDGQIDNVGEAG